MAELTICPVCKDWINLEIEVCRDERGRIYCKKCLGRIGEDAGDEVGGGVNISNQ